MSAVTQPQPPSAPPKPGFLHLIFGSAPGEDWRDRVKGAGARMIRTFMQGVAGAFPSAGAGTTILTVGYWEAFGYAVLAAFIGAVISFLQNAFGPGTDPSQKAI